MSKKESDEESSSDVEFDEQLRKVVEGDNDLINVGTVTGVTTVTEDGDPVQQFNNVVAYLRKTHLMKTLDCLLEEYDKALFQTDSVALLNENNSDCIKVLDKSFDKIHKGTILSINFDHSGDILFTTSSDKVITAFTIEGELIAVSTTLEAPIISFSLHPIIPNLFVFGCMDFSHGLLVFDEDNKISKFNILKKWKLHEKYIINVKWSPDGNFFLLLLPGMENFHYLS